MSPVPFLQTGDLVVGNRLLPPADRALQASPDRPASLTHGHRACQGCTEMLAARWAIDAAAAATGGRVMVVTATGCLEVVSALYPRSAWRVPWLHSLFGNAPAVAAGLAAANRARGRDDVRVVAQGGDGATVDIGLGALSGMFERDDDVLYICYDNEAYMNTGVQRSGSTPPAARTTTTPVGPGRPGNPARHGKDLPRIAMAHAIPYVATATAADPRDLEAKVTRAMSFRGARYLHVLVPCPLGWSSDPAAGVEIARLAWRSGLFPLFEAEGGRITAVTPIRDRVPVEDYLRLQGRFAHLLGPDGDAAALARVRELAEENIRRFGLLGEDGPR
jgi:pyruvate ferredoxin oxidoreductase beta subunit